MTAIPQATADKIRQPAIAVEGLPPAGLGHLPEATVAQTNHALLCREFGVADDAGDEVLNAAIVEAGVVRVGEE